MLLKDRLKPYRLILASASPRRRELIDGLGLEYCLADRFGVDEVFDTSMPAERVPEYLSGLKSDGYPVALSDNDILITADTVVILDGEILGKPHDAEEAEKMLHRLSGREHKVVTGVTLRSKSLKYGFSVETSVRFGVLSDEQIRFYVDRYCPMDKAGAYGIQEWIGFVAIESINGSFYNVMGLPVQRLYAELERFVDELER